MGDRDLNLYLHICAASILLSEHLSCPQIQYLEKDTGDCNVEDGLVVR